MSFIDQKINLGYEKQITEAVAFYTKVPIESIHVSNDEIASELTVITLHPVNLSAPRLKLALQELERFKGAMIETEGSDDEVTVRFRINDEVICNFTEELLEKKAKKEQKSSAS